jgi:hypothetical protein
VQRLTRVSLEHSRVLLAALATVTLLLAAGLPGVRSEYRCEVLMIGHDHSAVASLERQVATFGGGLDVKLACGLELLTRTRAAGSRRPCADSHN